MVDLDIREMKTPPSQPIPFYKPYIQDFFRMTVANQLEGIEHLSGCFLNQRLSGIELEMRGMKSMVERSGLIYRHQQ